MYLLFRFVHVSDLCRIIGIIMVSVMFRRICIDIVPVNFGPAILSIFGIAVSPLLAIFLIFSLWLVMFCIA